MKRILISAALGVAASLGAMFQGPLNVSSRGPSKRQLRRAYSAMLRPPEGKRHWHNSADPIQASLIEAAAAKRERRADKLRQDANRSCRNNAAHGRCASFIFNPFYINR